jgi:carboxymethylenebutenolidase
MFVSSSSDIYLIHFTKIKITCLKKHFSPYSSWLSVHLRATTVPIREKNKPVLMICHSSPMTRTFKEKHETPAQIDFQGKGESLEFDTPDGQKGSAYALMPEGKTNKYLLVFHEWWGLNDQIRQEAERLFEELDGVAVMAIDLYDGEVTDDQDRAGELTQAASQKEDRLKAIIQGAMNYAGDEAEIATIGWCFGGGWSLKASIMAGEQGAGCVMYYGMPVREAEALQPLEADVLGIFAGQDGWITPEVANNFKALADNNGKNVEIHIFDADHAFANPSSPRYVEEAAQKANELALEFLKEKL